MLTVSDIRQVEHSLEREQRRLAATVVRHPPLCHCHLCAVNSLLDDALWTLGQERARLCAELDITTAPF
jgi:hypothetical protein